MKTTLIIVGKVKERFCTDGISEFKKRIKNLEIVQIDDSRANDGILRHLNNNTYDEIIALDEHGEEITSVKFAEFIKKNQDKKICFLIGPANGLTKEIINKATYVLALSQMTFTHEMAQLFFIEQLYRAQTILDGKKYHRN